MSQNRVPNSKNWSQKQSIFTRCIFLSMSIIMFYFYWKMYNQVFMLFFKTINFVTPTPLIQTIYLDLYLVLEKQTWKWYRYVCHIQRSLFWIDNNFSMKIQHRHRGSKYRLFVRLFVCLSFLGSKSDHMQIDRKRVHMYLILMQSYIYNVQDSTSFFLANGCREDIIEPLSWFLKIINIFKSY